MNTQVICRLIGRIVKERRTAMALTQKQLSLASEVSERLIRTLEAGRAEGIGLDKLISVFSVLKITINFECSNSETSGYYGLKTQDTAYQDAFSDLIAKFSSDNSALPEQTSKLP